MYVQPLPAYRSLVTTARLSSTLIVFAFIRYCWSAFRYYLPRTTALTTALTTVIITALTTVIVTALTTVIVTALTTVIVTALITAAITNTISS